MRIHVLFRSVILGLLIAAPVWGDPNDAYVQAYFLIREGEKLENKGDSAGAIEKYTLGLQGIREIQRTAPSWNSTIIAFRTKFCVDHIRKLGGAVEPEGAAPASAPAQPQPPAPATRPTAPATGDAFAVHSPRYVGITADEIQPASHVILDRVLGDNETPRKDIADTRNVRYSLGVFDWVLRNHKEPGE